MEDHLASANFSDLKAFEQMSPTDKANFAVKFATGILSKSWSATVWLTDQLKEEVLANPDEFAKFADFFAWFIRAFNAVKEKLIPLMWILGDKLAAWGPNNPSSQKPSKSSTHSSSSSSSSSSLTKGKSTKDKTHPQSTVDGPPCNHCGRTRHGDTSNCDTTQFTGEAAKYVNPDATVLFRDSPQGKKLQSEWNLKYIPTTFYSSKQGAGKKEDSKYKTKKCKYTNEPRCTCDNCDEHIAAVSDCSLIHNNSPNLLLQLTLHAQNGSTKQLKALADPGAQQSSYAGVEVGEWLKANDSVGTTCNRTICGAVGRDNCVHTEHCQTLRLSMHPQKGINTLTKELHFSIPDVAVLPITSTQHNIDIIVGLPAFRANKLFSTLSPLLEGGEVTDRQWPRKRGFHDTAPSMAPTSEGYKLSRLVQASKPPEGGTQPARISCGETSSTMLTSSVRTFSSRELRDSLVLDDSNTFAERESDLVCEKPCIWAEPEVVAAVREGDQCGWLSAAELAGRGPRSPTRIWGTPRERKILCDLCDEFQDIFDTELNPQPALVEPMTIQVDEAMWYVRENRLPARTMSTIKQAEVATAWSQCMLTPKPGGKLRLVHDYRRLNECTTSQSWPLPNIGSMLNRLGSHKHTRYGCMDLKDGYYQGPLALESQKYTTFITFAGLYMFGRVPQGAKGAGAYFQWMISFIVFLGLTYVILEVYLDDIAVHDQGKGFDQFVHNLRLTFTRLRERRLIVHPAKTVLNVPKLEFVGHTIDHTGKHFSKEKLDKVLDIELPVWGKGLKSFLGLTNWFSAHVHNYAQKAHTLHQLVKNYEQTKNIKISWTPDTRAAFDLLKKEINDCPKLYFVDEAGDIILETDASDYGIGAVLYQLHPGSKEKRIVGFMSRMLTPPQMAWSTYEKEGYAIYAAVMKFYHILGDRHFKIKTDHRNLTFIRDDGSLRVRNWKNEIAQFDFSLTYFEGAENECGDGFSRLLPVDEVTLRKAKGLPPRTREGVFHMWEEVTSENKWHWQLPDPRLGETSSLATHVATNIYSKVAEHLAAISEANTTSNRFFAQQQREAHRLPITAEHMQWMQAVHNSTCGHVGQNIMHMRLRQAQHTWEGMRTDIKRFTEMCPLCQKLSQIKPLIHVNPMTLASYSPMQFISMDTIGPLPADDLDNKYILVVIDHFTRWTELYAIPSVTADEACRKLLIFFGRFGFAEVVSTDGGTQFCNQLTKAFFKAVVSKHTVCTPHSKEEMGIVERENKEVLRHIRALIFDKNSLEQWGSVELPLANRIINAMPKKATGLSPAQLLFGNAVSLDRSILQRAGTTEAVEQPLSVYVEKLQAAQEELIFRAQNLQAETDMYHIAKRTGTGAATVFPVGSYVLVAPPADNLVQGSAEGKLFPPLAGPFRVVNIDRKGTMYTLANLLTSKANDVHVSRVREFKYDLRITDPVEVAKRDIHEETVDRIIKHRGTPNQKTKMQFLVRWKGPEGRIRINDSWLPWKELRLVEALHTYLHANGMSKLVPK